MSDEAVKKSLVSKLAEVMAIIERIPKRGRNDFHKYDYATEADIAATVRAELAARHVMLIPSIVGEQRHPVGEKGSVLTVLEMEMEFVDGETGESVKKPWRGYGTDKEDKGGYKAMTGGEKYFLLKTFLMPTGDDPEVDEKPKGKPAYTVEAPAAASLNAAVLQPAAGTVENPGPPPPITTAISPPWRIRKAEKAGKGAKAAGFVHFSWQEVGTNGFPVYYDKLLALAEQMQQDGDYVEAEIKESENKPGNFYIKSLKRAEKKDEPQPMLTADQVPF